MTGFFCFHNIVRADSIVRNMLRRGLIIWVLIQLGVGFAAQAEPLPAQIAPGMKIRSIKIIVRDVFEGEKLAKFYETANSLKSSTKTAVVKRELLFKEGDEYDPFVIEESERNLRSLPFLRKISIVPVPDGDAVDVVVSVQDTWTLFPLINANIGGANKKSVGIAEKNLLGYGKRVEALYADDEGRQKIEGVVEDPRVMGTYQRVLLGHFQRSDGFHSVASYGRPFRSLLEPTSWNVDAEGFDLVDRLFENNDERYIFRHRRQAVQGGYTFSHGNPEVLLQRFTVGYDYSRDIFKDATDSDFDEANVDFEGVSRDHSLLAENRTFSGPFIGFQLIQPDFISLNYIDRFERVEDFNLGNEFDSHIGFAPDVLGSDNDTLLVSISDSDGMRTGSHAFLRGEIGVSGRVDQHETDNTIIHMDLKYYNVLGSRYLSDFYLGRHTIASSLLVDWGENLDKDKELLLGATDGLRGYKDRTFTGDQRIIFNLEDRFHVVEDFAKLVSIGGAVFFDAGGTGSSGLADIVSDDLFSDVGFGFRFGVPRASGGAVIRFDIAFPLRDGPDGTDKYQPRFLITTGGAFNARLRSEVPTLQATTTSMNFSR